MVLETNQQPPKKKTHYKDLRGFPHYPVTVQSWKALLSVRGSINSPCTCSVHGYENTR